MTNQALTFAVTDVTSRRVIYAVEAASADQAGQMAASALCRTKPPASWHVERLDKLPSDLAVEATAVLVGVRDGLNAVDTLLNAEGRDAVLKTLRPGQEDWDFEARNADAAGHRGIAKGSREAYYRAYGRVARCRAEQIEDEG